MAKQNALVRKMPAGRNAGLHQCDLLRQTGTLTKGEMNVRRLHVGGRTVEVSGGAILSKAASTRKPTISACSCCSRPGACERCRGRAGRRALVRQGRPDRGCARGGGGKGGLKTDETRQNAPRVEEFPFSSERKRMTTIHAMPDGRRMAFMKGAPEVVLERCASSQSSGGTVPLDAGERAKLLQSTSRWRRMHCAYSVSRIKSCRAGINILKTSREGSGVPGYAA